MRYELINNVECKVFEACDVEAVSEEPILLYWTKLAGKNQATHLGINGYLYPRIMRIMSSIILKSG